MKKLKDYLKETTKFKKIMAPQDSSNEALWKSNKDRWSRNAKHPIKTQDIMESEINEISTEKLKAYTDKARPQIRVTKDSSKEDQAKAWKRTRGVGAASDIIKDREHPVEPKVHDLQHMDDGEVYDTTQTDDNIKDGDVLQMSGGRTAVLYKAWPVMVVGKSKALHSLTAGTSWDTFQRGRYIKSAELARQIAEPSTDEGVLNENVMGGLQAVDPLSRMMQLAGLSFNSIIEPDNKESLLELDSSNMFNQLVTTQLNGEFKNNPNAARLAAVGEVLTGLSTVIDQLEANGTQIPQDMMEKLKATPAIGVLAITEARKMIKP